MRETDHVAEVIELWRHELPRLDRSAFEVVGRVSRLAQRIAAEVEPIFLSRGLTRGEFDVLAALRRSGRPYRLSPTELSRALIVTSGGMTKRLRSLEDRDLIRRQPDPADARSSTVVLTPAGKRLVETILPAHVANEDRLVAGLTRNQRDELAHLLEMFAVALGDTAKTRRVTLTRRRRSG